MVSRKDTAITDISPAMGPAETGGKYSFMFLTLAYCFCGSYTQKCPIILLIGLLLEVLNPSLVQV